MRWNQFKPLSGFVVGLLLTTFVTACVKNAGKNDKSEVQFKELQSQELTLAQVEGNAEIVVEDVSEVPAAEITQVFRFNITDIREMRFRQGELKNDECRADGSFLPSFTLTGPDGVEKPVRGRRNPELLVPGSYLLQVKAENGSLCKKISMKIHLDSKVRSDLTLTGRDNRGYICNNVAENGVTKADTTVRVNTAPMQVIKYEKLVSGQTVAVPVETDQMHCQMELASNTECSDSLLPTDVDSRPVVAVQKNCISDDQVRNRGFSHLLVRRAQGVGQTIDFTCRHRRNNITLRMTGCQGIFNLGETLPLRSGQTDIMLRRHRMNINFEPIYGDLNDQNIPGDLYAGIVKKVTDEDITYYEPIHPNFESISKDDLLDGQIQIQEHNLRLMLLNNNANDLVLVLSQTPDLRHGIFHMNFSSLCADSENTLAIANGPNGRSSLCEEN